MPALYERVLIIDGVDFDNSDNKKDTDGVIVLFNTTCILIYFSQRLIAFGTKEKRSYTALKATQWRSANYTEIGTMPTTSRTHRNLT